MKYMREGLEDKYGILKLQDKILEIIIYLDQFCEEHGIEYFLMGGSALGAKRHGGFIPWDDDLDIFMTPDNYEKFRKIFEIEGDKKNYYLQEYGRRRNGLVTVPKLRMNGTLYLEEFTKDWDIHKGIYIDIFILHNCPNKLLLRLWQWFWAKCVVVKGLSMKGYNRHSGVRKMLISLANLIPERIMLDYALTQVYRFRNQKTKYTCNFLGKAIYKDAIYNTEWFSTSIKMPFETIKLKVPIGINDFLSKRFGDYMAIPSEERIKWEQHALKWDTDNGTDNFQGENNRVYQDENRLI